MKMKTKRKWQKTSETEYGLWKNKHYRQTYSQTNHKKKRLKLKLEKGICQQMSLKSRGLLENIFKI
jgi:hypothetical protein